MSIVCFVTDVVSFRSGAAVSAAAAEGRAAAGGCWAARLPSGRTRMRTAIKVRVRARMQIASRTAHIIPKRLWYPCRRVVPGGNMLNRRTSSLALALLAVVPAALQSRQAPVDFARDVEPILQKHC